MLRAGQGRGVGRRLQVTVGLVPGAAVDDERGHADQRHQRDCDEDERLPGVVEDACPQRAHSSRSVAFAVRSPEALKPGSPML